ncbi:MAG TPA: tyrosine-type recombinase/integrase [Acidimicrobiales bacterium]|nr:tyrosine-type recombinase/integrase [Acidimicrobiales bacterium]
MNEQPVTAEVVDPRWEPIAARAPQLATTMGAYLEQMSLSLRPQSISAFELALRIFAGFLIEEDRRLRRVRQVRRHHIEAYKTWLTNRPVGAGRTMAARTIRHRLGILRVFFERIIEWGWADAPRACPIFDSDMPKVDDPLPRFLDDASAAAFMRAAALAAPLERLVIEMLARTGLRVGELCALEANAVVRIGATHWLRVPVGKLHNDRYLPLHPILVELLDAWRAEEANNDEKLLITDAGQPLDRHRVSRIVKRMGHAAGIGHVHPHRLRHTLATQAINRGMSLEAIAALLGHKSLRMTLVYARIADRKVADEYFSVTEQVEALYSAERPELPASAEGQKMRQLRLEMQRRLLGNGYCTRPIELDCAFETVCETCVHFATGPEFVPILIRQRDHATERNHEHLASVYDRLITTIEDTDQTEPGYAGNHPDNPGSPA